MTGLPPSSGRPSATTSPTRTNGTTVRRLPKLQVSDRGALDRLLDAELVGHVALVLDDGGRPQPYALPVAFARDHDSVLIHGSTASHAFRALATGQRACFTVSVVDGVIVARSQFASSLRYRSAMVFGSFETLHGAPKARALQVLAARLLRGVDGPRPPSPQELAATAVLELPLEEWSLKVSAGHPDDSPADLDRPTWAGVVPLLHVWGAPLDAPDLRPGVTPPAPTTREARPR